MAESCVTALSEEKYSYEQVIKHLKNHGYCTSNKVFIIILNLQEKV